MVLIIYAHPSDKSFNHAVLETVKQSLSDSNKTYDVIDLYADKYNPVLSLEEMLGTSSPETLSYQKRIKNATSIVFVFPVWWFRAPAILEGFLDKTFTPKFAYRFKQLIGNIGIPIPLLRDKKVLTIVTHGAPALPVKILYVNAVKYRFLLGFLSFCFNIFKCKIVQLWSVPFSTDVKRKKYLSKVSRVVGSFVE